MTQEERTITIAAIKEITQSMHLALPVWQDRLTLVMKLQSMLLDDKEEAQPAAKKQYSGGEENRIAIDELTALKNISKVAQEASIKLRDSIRKLNACFGSPE
jgi:hypothetical protein